MTQITQARRVPNVKGLTEPGDYCVVDTPGDNPYRAIHFLVPLTRDVTPDEAEGVQVAPEPVYRIDEHEDGSASIRTTIAVWGAEGAVWSGHLDEGNVWRHDD